ncbi:tubulin nucleotide-binding domain-like protein [Trametes elegans]|nr:tubulin nucleotide-binding domain-like protein [Trametes elegans]
MKEILYVQAGPLANFVGTHFWNAQESYFTYGEDEDPDVFHDRSFREGVTSKGDPTFCPRLIVFDRKSHFGALADELYGNTSDADVAQWEKGVVEYRQDPIPKSDYQTHLDQEETGEREDRNEAESGAETAKIRYWSDYSRVYYHPRTAQKVPDIPEWERAEGEWSKSKELFQEYEHEHETMENEVRLFVEECDGLQGVQLTGDCGTFGGFTDAFLTAFRDEYSKVPSLAFSLLSNASNIPVSVDEEQNAMKAINDALSLRGLEALSTISVPIQNPSTWRQEPLLDGLDLDLRSPYQTSALLATHIESVTLPLRLKRSQHDISSLSSLLDASGTLGVSHLSGMYPVAAHVAWSRETEKRIFDLSAVAEAPADQRTVPITEYARLQVSRGFAPSEHAKYDEYFSGKSPAPFSIHAPPYPTPTSFPHFFAPSPSGMPNSGEEKHRVLSSLSTSSATAPLFAAHATLVQQCVDRRADVVGRMGLEFDEMRELKDDLWALCDRYAGPDGEWKTEEDVLSEDEE